MKTFLLILGVVLLALGARDVVRLLIDNNASSLFGWIPGGFTVHIAAGVVVAVAGVLVAGYASKKQSKGWMFTGDSVSVN